MVVGRRERLGHRSETVRRANLSAIVRELHLHGRLTRSELVARTGLTRSAIRALIGELVAADLAFEEPSQPLGAPGRPSPSVRPRADRVAVLALDIAVDSQAAAIVGLGGAVLAEERTDRPGGHLAVEDALGDLAALAREVLWRAGAPELLIGTGVAVVGIVRRSDGFVSMAPNLGWRDVDLGERLAAALALDGPIAIGNDADLGALAELRRGAAVNVRDVIYVSGEVGVGGGVIVDGRPLTGIAGYGGEIGHLPVNPAGARCGCGSVGCWETEIGERALLVRAGLPAEGGRAAVDELIRAATERDPRAIEALEEQGRWLGIGLAGLINVFNPRQVVLGGLIGRIHPFVAEVLERELDRMTLPGPRDMVRIVPAMLGTDAPLLGAAELAFEPILADPAAWVGRRSRPLATAGRAT